MLPTWINLRIFAAHKLAVPATKVTGIVFDIDARTSRVRMQALVDGVKTRTTEVQVDRSQLLVLGGVYAEQYGEDRILRALINVDYAKGSAAVTVFYLDPSDNERQRTDHFRTGT